MKNDFFGAFDVLSLGSQKFGYYRLSALEDQGLVRLCDLPYSIRILLESVLRNCDGLAFTESDVKRLAAWSAEDRASETEIPFMPARVILQDFTGVPAVVDLAAMRSSMKKIGGDPRKINPLIPVDLVIDHSIQVDYFGCREALAKNVDLEFDRNRERYSLLHWAQKSLDNFHAVPPSAGIIHQINLEYLGQVVFQGKSEDPDLQGIVYPDSVVGTDSHTVMINGLGVLGWGVGGIEAEAVMLGQPYYMLAPQVIGVELTGELPATATATDLVLTITEMLRKEGVVGKFVEYFGEGAFSMSVADRAVVANMGPEYGATMGFFPVDQKAIDFLAQTGRSADHIALVEAYTKAQGIFRTPESPIPHYTKTLSFDLSSVVPSLAGPKRPQDRIPLSQMKESFQKTLRTPVKDRGFGLTEEAIAQKAEVNGAEMGQGSVVIASITSCTNTSNPDLMIAAGLLARNAVKRGLKVKPFVKTSLGPGSRVVSDYLIKAGLMDDLEQLGFHVVGYGCLTCIGNSGPLPEPVAEAVQKNDLIASAVLSGNRNFEGRINPLVKANYLANPALVIAYAIAGTVDIDLVNEPIGSDPDGNPVMLSEIFPHREEIQKIAKDAVSSDLYRKEYDHVYESNPLWNSIPTIPSELFDWDRTSTYIQEPPFLDGLTIDPKPIEPIKGARALLLLGDSVTTDHISPAGAIKKDSPAGEYLLDRDVPFDAFNSYGSRRGNDRVMVRGTFANIRIRNLLVPGSEGGITKYFGKTDLSGPEMSVYEAAVNYQRENIPLIVLAGSEYGTGSSRDWAAKGTALLGVRAVIAVGFERIHRGNLVGMGVLPLEFPQGENAKSLGLDGTEIFSIDPIGPDFKPQSTIQVVAHSNDPDRKDIVFDAKVRIDTPVELIYYLNGGIMPTVLRKLAAN